MIDRLKGPLAAIVRALTGRIDYLAYYRARVVSQSSDFSTVDVQPDATMLPGFSAIPLKPPLPGAVVQVQNGAYVMVGFENGDATRPYALPIWDAGATLTKLVANGQLIVLGADDGATQFVALAQKVLDQLNSMASTFNNHTHLIPGAGTVCVNGSPWTGTATSQAPVSTMNPSSVAAALVKAK